MVTKLCIIEEGASRRLSDYMKEACLSGPCCVIYDTNTYDIPELSHPAASQEIVLEAKGLHATEAVLDHVLSTLRPDISCIVSAGTGTITDIGRYCATEKHIPFVSMPTAMSCDAFTSNVAAISVNGYKVTLPKVPPVLVVADLGVIANAPWFLTASGIADLLAKYTALADWRISHLVTGEYLCEDIYALTRKALLDVAGSVDSIMEGSYDAYEALTYGLLLSGIAIQMTGNSRPASGAEHHISHFIEIEPPSLGVRTDALHGEKVGVGLVIVSGIYHEMAGHEDISPLLEPYSPVPEETFLAFFGPELAPSSMKENKDDCLAKVTPEALSAEWPEIRKIIQNDIPSQEELLSLLGKIHAKRTLSDIGVPEDKLRLLVEASPLMRNRLTLMRMRRLFKSL